MKKNWLFPDRRIFPFRSGKTFRIMKISVFLFLTGIISIYAANSYSQTTRLSLDLRETTVGEVLTNIENQSEFYFLYSNKLVDVNRKVSLQAKNKSVSNILDHLFADTDIRYLVYDRQIILSPEEMLKKTIEQQNAPPQEIVITGKVSDEDGNPLPGVNILIKGTLAGTISNADGNYSIEVDDPNATLVFSFIGFIPQEIAVGNQTSINVSMEVDAIGIKEVVAIGYGTQEKASLTGAIGNVEGEALEKVPSLSLSNTLAGKMPGLVTLNRSGEPGEDFSTFFIRGVSTLGNNSPLVVIDGVAGRGGVNTINPRDIESISILKDASAAIYGAQAANGVILITTKRGKSGKPTISYSANQGIVQPTRMPEMADAATYAEYLNYQLGLFNQSPQYTLEDIQKFRDGSSPLTHPNTDWIDETVKNFSTQSQHNLSVRGGNENVKYFVAGNYSNQDGIFKNGLHDYKVLGGRSNIDVNITDNLLVSAGLYFTETNQMRPYTPTKGILQSAYRGYPTLMNILPNGKPGYALATFQNPTVQATDATGFRNDKQYLYQTTFSFKYDIPFVNGLGLTGQIAYDQQQNDYKGWALPYFLYAYDAEDDSYSETKVGPTNPQLDQQSSLRTKVDENIRLTYSIENETHRLNAFAAVEQTENKYNFIYVFRQDYATSAIDQIFAGSPVNMQTDGSATRFARRNYFGRISYGYQNKYLVDFNIRYDGSTNFPKSKRYGLFPGISVGWVISDEPFLQGLEFVDQLKLRGSWGQMGNDQIDPFQYLAAYTITSGAFFGTSRELQQGIRKSVEPNINVTWEVANITNVGFDATLWEGMLAVTADVFKTRRENILSQRSASIPNFTGLSLPDENIGIVENSGFELQLSHQRNVRDNFNYTVRGNASYARNKVIFVDEAIDRLEWQKSEGLPMNSDLYYINKGIYRSQEEIDNSPHPSGTRVGDLQYEDVNGDQVIDSRDRKRLDKTAIPEIVFGSGFSVQYNSFDLDVFFQGQGRAWKYYYIPQGVFGNVIKEMAENRPGPNNPNSKYPNIYSDEGEPGAWDSDFWLYSASFVRLKSLELGYKLPSNLLSKLGIINARIYVNGLNLLTIDKLKYIDPEGDVNRGLHYPQNRVFNFGIDITI